MQLSYVIILGEVLYVLPMIRNIYMYNLGKVCDVLDVGYGSKNTTDIEFETVVHFTCDEGYVKDGVDEDGMTAFCDGDSQWSQSIPDCRRKQPYISCNSYSFCHGAQSILFYFSHPLLGHSTDQ